MSDPPHFQRVRSERLDIVWLPSDMDVDGNIAILSRESLTVAETIGAALCRRKIRDVVERARRTFVVKR